MTAVWLGRCLNPACAPVSCTAVGRSDGRDDEQLEDKEANPEKMMIGTEAAASSFCRNPHGVIMFQDIFVAVVAAAVAAVAVVVPKIAGAFHDIQESLCCCLTLAPRQLKPLHNMYYAY